MKVAPQAGLEPATLRLTAGCSAIELLRNSGGQRARRAPSGRAGPDMVLNPERTRQRSRSGPAAFALRGLRRVYRSPIEIARDESNAQHHGFGATTPPSRRP